MFLKASYIFFLVLQVTLLIGVQPTRLGNGHKVTGLLSTLRSKTLSDKDQIEILSVPKLRIVRVYMKTLFISSSILDLIVELKEDIYDFNANLNDCLDDLYDKAIFKKLFESLKKLQRKLIQEFDFGVPLLVPRINNYEFSIKTIEAWIVFNIDKLSKLLDKIDIYSQVIKEGNINDKYERKLRNFMLKISDRIQYIIKWFQVYTEYKEEEPSLYFILTDYFNDIELLNSKEDIKSSVLFCHSNNLLLKFSNIKYKIENLVPYIPKKANELFHVIDDSSHTFEQLKIFCKKALILKSEFESNCKICLNEKEIDLTNLKVTDIVIKIYQNINDLNKILYKLIEQLPLNVEKTSV